MAAGVKGHDLLLAAPGGHCRLGGGSPGHRERPRPQHYRLSPAPPLTSHPNCRKPTRDPPSKAVVSGTFTRRGARHLPASQGGRGAGWPRPRDPHPTPPHSDPVPLIQHLHRWMWLGGGWPAVSVCFSQSPSISLTTPPTVQSGICRQRWQMTL